MVEATALAPGARVAIRDEEWIVRSIKAASTGGSAVRVAGVSELVRGKEATFLTELDPITELRPEETELTYDRSPRYRQSRLYLESLLRRTPPTEPALYVGHRAALQHADYQLQPAAKALAQIRPRILMADAVGLGKTIEVGVLLSELIRRGRGDRILVVALKSILVQFQEELWARFTIPLVRLDSVGIQRVQTKIPSNMNPFYYYNRAIISIDTLKRDAKYRRYLEQAHWDVIVVDECQNVALRGGKGSQRARLAQLLARKADALILTSATPHDGKPESFASLISLLEPTAVADQAKYTRADIGDYFIRRFKKDIAHQALGAFPERETLPHIVPANAPENVVFDLLKAATFKTIDGHRNSSGILFRTLLLKAFLSSPAACASTIENRLAHKDLADESIADVRHDRGVLSEILTAVNAVSHKDFAKYQQLKLLLADMNAAAPTGERAVIFSERIQTLEFLQKTLTKDLKLTSGQIEIFYGTLDDQAQKNLVKGFGTAKSPIRILLASDAASEGVNLHYYCSNLFHFDLPWSLITLEQRNGRIDRFGQQHTPRLHYLLTEPSDKKLKGDLRVLELLMQREAWVVKNLGDPATLMGVFEVSLEEDLIAAGIQSGADPATVIPPQPKVIDFLELMNTADEGEPPPETRTPTTLFHNDLDYAREAFAEALEGEDLQIEWHDHLAGFSLLPPSDLSKRLDYLPSELRDPRTGELKLTVDRKLVMKSLADAREEEGKWPEWQLFWEQHPVAEWLADRVLSKIERHHAPILELQRGIAPNERVFLIQGVISNRRSQPVRVEWFGVTTVDDRIKGTRTLADLISATGLSTTASNPNDDISKSELRHLLEMRAPVVDAALDHMRRLREERAAQLSGTLRTGQERLRKWKDAVASRIDADLQGANASGGAAHQRTRLQHERSEAEKQFEARQDWVNTVLKTIEKPYIRLAAVFVPHGV